MGFLEWFVGAFVLIIGVLVFMQPLSIMVDTASDVVESSNVTKYGTDIDGNVVEVGDSVFGVDLLFGFLGLIGLAFFVGFIIWSFKGANSGGSYGGGFDEW
jgi:hypothetical protein